MAILQSGLVLRQFWKTLSAELLMGFGIVIGLLMVIGGTHFRRYSSLG